MLTEINKLVSNSSKILLTDNTELFGNSSLDEVDISSVPEYPLFLPYQIKWLTDKNTISITEKSRQIGWSYIHAFRAVYKAVRNERDTIVTTYNKSAIKQFIKDCTFWSKIFNKIFKITTDKDIVKDRSINIFEIRFINGRTITGLPGDAVNLRSYSGRDIVIDEAAYRSQPLDDILAAGMAGIIHGGSIRIGSTHAGTDSEFLSLINDCKKGKKPFTVHRTTFKEAVAEGLFKRICAKKNEPWDMLKEVLWIKSIYDNYGIRATEELDVIPSDFTQEGKIFGRFQIGEIDESRYWEYKYCRYHDLAATAESDDVNHTAFYSASIKLAYHDLSKTVIIVDWVAQQVDAKDGDSLILETAVSDGNQVTQILEIEPGSTGKKWHSYMEERLSDKGIFNVVGYAPKLQKLRRMIPVANAQSKGMVRRLNNNYLLDLENNLRKASAKKQPLVSDLADCLSGGFDWIINENNWYY
jgi:phage terminase large subunit-like protein